MPRTAQHLPQGQVDLPYMAGLTPDEDRELRRLHALAEFGALTEQMSELYDDLRERDRRSTVREPRDVAVPYPRSDEPEVGSGVPFLCMIMKSPSLAISMSLPSSLPLLACSSRIIFSTAAWSVPGLSFR